MWAGGWQVGHSDSSQGEEVCAAGVWSGRTRSEAAGRDIGHYWGTPVR